MSDSNATDNTLDCLHRIEALLLKGFIKSHKPTPTLEAADISDEALLFLNTLEPSPTVDSVRAAFEAIKRYRLGDKVEAASAPEKPTIPHFGNALVKLLEEYGFSTKGIHHVTIDGNRDEGFTVSLTGEVI